jgi:hypothetical protein
MYEKMDFCTMGSVSAVGLVGIVMGEWKPSGGVKRQNQGDAYHNGFD